MARYRKRRVYKRKRRGFKRSFRRKYRVGRSSNNKIYYYTRYMSGSALGVLAINNINDTFFGYNFSLNDVVNYTEFTALYDQYKINAIKITFLPQMTENVSLTTVNNAWANVRFYSAIDRNSATAPITVDQVREYKTCKYTPILKPHKRYIYKPKILDTNGFSISPWMATASATANYYGIIGAVEAMLSTGVTNMTYTIEAKFYLAFRNVK